MGSPAATRTSFASIHVVEKRVQRRRTSASPLRGWGPGTRQSRPQSGAVSFATASQMQRHSTKSKLRGGRPLLCLDEVICYAKADGVVCNCFADAKALDKVVRTAPLCGGRPLLHYSASPLCGWTDGVPRRNADVICVHPRSGGAGAKAEDIRFSTTWMGSRHSTKSSAERCGVKKRRSEQKRKTTPAST
jgi:hypothetical protein